MELKIKATTVLPLCQIDGVEEKMINGKTVKVTTVQKLPVFVDMGDKKKVLRTPILTANGFRGKLRREATKLLIDKAIEKGIPLGKNALSIGKSFHAMNAGSSVIYTGSSFEGEDKIREANPVISEFGTSLAVSGRISVSPLIPKRLNSETGEYEYWYSVSEENGNIWSNITYINTQYKNDDVQRRTEYAAPLGKEFHIEWEKLVGEAKNDKKKQNIDAGHVLANEEIAVGVDFFGSIISSPSISDIEKGLLLVSIGNLSSKTFGAVGSKGRGKCDYEIIISDGEEENAGVIRSKWIEPFYSRCSVSYKLNKNLRKYVDAFNEWLENIDEDNIQIEKMLSKYATEAVDKE